MNWTKTAYTGLVALAVAGCRYENVRVNWGDQNKYVVYLDGERSQEITSNKIIVDGSSAKHLTLDCCDGPCTVRDEFQLTTETIITIERTENGIEWKESLLPRLPPMAYRIPSRTHLTNSMLTGPNRYCPPPRQPHCLPRR